MICGRCTKLILRNENYVASVENRQRKLLCQNCYDAKMRDVARATQEKLAANNYLIVHLSRASKFGLSATLTLEQWNETKEHFYQRCAYCLSSPLECLEHFVPLTLGGGTTQWNCVPACKTCNLKKRNYHPALVKLIPEEDIERVREYLMNFL